MDRTPPTTSGRSKSQRSDTGKSFTAASSHTRRTGFLNSKATADSITTAQLKKSLPDAFTIMNDEYTLVDCRAVKGSEDVGLQLDFNAAELDALYGVDGMVTKAMPLSQNKTTRKPKDPTRNTRCSTMMGVAFENKRTVYCGAGRCPCIGRIYRFRFGEIKGLLYYEKINSQTQSALEHQDHDLTRLESSVQQQHDETGSDKKPKYSEFTLTPQQKEFIIDRASRSHGLSLKEKRDLVIEMVASNDIRTTAAQDDDQERFLARVNEFINNQKRSKSDHSHFDKKQVADATTSEELQRILQFLSTSEMLINRPDIGYLASNEFKLIEKFLTVHQHDHDGKDWTYILFEHKHAPKLCELGVKMYPDRTIQLEKDFFLGICDADEWQVGHLGYTDRDHKYWLLCLIVAKSENHTAAGRLLARATKLLHDAGGDGKYVLVDGGKALDKAIGKENESRMKKLIEGVASRSTNPAAISAEPSDAVASSERSPSNVSEGDADYVFSETLDNTFDRTVEAIMEVGDEMGVGDEAEKRKERMEERLKVLLEGFKLGKQRCLAHITRNSESRGGGWRGGKGSLCRALLNNGCTKKDMKKVSK